MQLSCGATLRLDRPPLLMGEALDLSLHGIGLEVTRSIRPGTRIEVLLDTTVAPEGTLPDLPPLATTVVASRRVDDERFRLGLAIDDLPEALLEYVRDVATPTRVVVTSDDDTPARSGPSREALYQAAWARLGARHYEAAHRAALRALAGDPENRHYKALAHLAAGELFLARGHYGEALWEIMKAHAFWPREPRILSLLSLLRVPPPAVAWEAARAS